MIRRYGGPVKRDKPYILRPGAYCLILRGDAALLTFQADPFYELQLPGGGIDPGEHPIPALHREVMEETGWTVRVNRKIASYRRFTFMPEYDMWAEKICHIYLASPGLRKGPPIEENHTAVWMPVREAVHELASPGDRAIVGDFIR
jgi:8-oxo-dGTP diphosphatase